MANRYDPNYSLYLDPAIAHCSAVVTIRCWGGPDGVSFEFVEDSLVHEHETYRTEFTVPWTEWLPAISRLGGELYDRATTHNLCQTRPFLANTPGWVYVEWRE